jgi:hypothetical protein
VPHGKTSSNQSNEQGRAAQTNVDVKKTDRLVGGFRGRLCHYRKKIAERRGNQRKNKGKYRESHSFE